MRLGRCDEDKTCICSGLWLILCWLDCKTGHGIYNPICKLHDRAIWHLLKKKENNEPTDLA